MWANPLGNKLKKEKKDTNSRESSKYWLLDTGCIWDFYNTLTFWPLAHSITEHTHSPFFYINGGMYLNAILVEYNTTKNIYCSYRAKSTDIWNSKETNFCLELNQTFVYLKFTSTIEQDQEIKFSFVCVKFHTLNHKSTIRICSFLWFHGKQILVDFF